VRKASPKDDFPLPHIDVLVDNAARSSTYSFMDGFSGYNQIKMAPEDKANCEGLYVVKKAFSGGALKLARMDGKDLARPVNSDSVKRYYA